MHHLLPLQVPDFIEAVELLQTELLVLLFGIFVQSLEDTHHLPLSCSGITIAVRLEMNEGKLVTMRSILQTFGQLFMLTHAFLVDNSA